MVMDKCTDVSRYYIYFSIIMFYQIFERMRKRERTTMLINEAEVLEATHASLQVIDLHDEVDHDQGVDNGNGDGDGDDDDKICFRQKQQD